MEPYRINGVDYTESSLKIWCDSLLEKNETAKWLKEIASFILDWLDDSDSITLQTSGTTGKSKSYTRYKTSLISSAQLTCEFFGLDNSKTALLCLPAKYIAGKMMIVRSFISGMNLLIQESTSSPLKNLQNQSIDFCPMIPMQVENSLKDFPEAYNNIENVIIGGAPISFQLERKIIELTSNSYATFGMTETLSHVALKNISNSDKARPFKALNGIQFETEQGCLVISAPHLFSEKLKTTDVVELLDSESFIWKGRKDLIINSGGIKINPEEIERQIASLIDVEFFITSEPDALLGQKLILVLEDPNHSLDKDATLNLLKSKLAPHTAPKHVYHVTEFVRTPTGKIKRNETALSLGK